MREIVGGVKNEMHDAQIEFRIAQDECQERPASEASHAKQGRCGEELRIGQFQRLIWGSGSATYGYTARLTFGLDWKLRANGGK
jgi:hypothetical protein